MGFLNSFLEVIGFGIGIPIGLLLGFVIFIYFEPRNVEDPETKPLDELDSSSLHDLLPQLPLWVMNPDYERVDWLNKFMNDMWPFVDKAVSGIIKTSTEPIFAEYSGKYQIKSIAFDRFTLGTLPPTIIGLKAQDSNENQLVIDLSVRWAGNPDVVLVVKWLSLQLTAQTAGGFTSICSSQDSYETFRADIPLFLKLGNLVDGEVQPQVDFGLRVMGGDVMAIPGLYRFVQEIISKEVAKLYLWPRTLEIEILDSSIGAAKKPVGILHVKVVRAKNLLKMDFLGKSDPYVELSLTGERLPAKATTIKMNTLNPEWYEDFKLIVKDPDSQVLMIQMYDWEKVGTHDYLGMQSVPLNLLCPYDKKEFTLNLLNSMDPTDHRNKKPRGELTLEISFVPFQEDSKRFQSMDFSADGSPFNFNDTKFLCGSGLLLVTVVGAEDVEGKHHSINPYAVILFRGELRKTKTIKKTRDPDWNEEFQFVLEEAPIKDVIHIEVMSKKRRIGIMSKESLGHVDINLVDVVSNGHINEKYNLINSRDGVIHLDIRWKMI